ncbi:helix-turn-helix domain-containing protein [Brevibacillus parabrevis]|jgi:DNA binding domain, excisionase family|uniref:helix-turn-helix domain-containing protein n=1 Tax=Brevibacillus parabrevis TaxID=54914 RepID=UPI0024922F5F|nr:helix-turn-helix domain-containing protein [Brevibacillus parabrevis]
MRTSTRRKTNRSISPAVIVHTAQPVEQQSDASQLIQQLAQALLQQQQVRAVQPKRNVLTVEEAWEEVFECKISKYKLYQLLRNGECPSVKIGSKYILRRDTLEVWLRQREQGYQ